MTKQITITYYGLQASGRNQTEAKREAGKIIERGMTGSYTPWLITCRDVAGLLYRDPISGWNFVWLSHKEWPLDSAKWLYASSHCQDAQNSDKARSEARMWVAQQAWDPDTDGVQPPENVLRDEQCAEFHLWAHWQLSFRHLTKHGVNANDAPQILGGLKPWPTHIAQLSAAGTPIVEATA